MADVRIETWREAHDLWREVRRAVDTLGQTSWVDFTAPWHRDSHVLVALDGHTVVGFLKVVVQPIGPELDREPFELGGEPLLEAKVLAFGVLPQYRRRGIGRALQVRARDLARDLGCFQVRSHSSGNNEANHRLKLSLGYAVVPILRGDDGRGAYFVLPLSGPS